MMMKLIVALCILVLMAGCASVDAFVTPTSTATPPSVTTSTELYAANGPPDTATKDIPYGEISRQYRRTVYTHDDWVKHRSPNRFIKNLFTIFNSGVYKVRTVYVYVYVVFICWRLLLCK
jgi:putative membrane protein